MVVGFAAWWAWPKWEAWHATIGPNESWCLELEPTNGTAPSDQAAWRPEGWEAIETVAQWRNWTLRPGRYCVEGSLPAHVLARRIATGVREEIAVPIPSKRHISEIAGVVASRIWADSTSLEAALSIDSMRWRILPNTYRIYWEADASSLAQRLHKEHRNWWNEERLAKAARLGISPREVTVLASIVQEETAVVAEAPRVAGLYLNRLNKKMLLQADPTLKFALGDWKIQRLLDADKRIDSPYNTYRNPGLPPGPIRIPEIAYIASVLHAEDHDFLYMCAKPDGSGTHAFAKRYSEHLQNARAYQRMLNRERIYR